mmetsp:Transcript_42380/g.76948  ORF Transcript_42380/g.76948 Transcript_42380/m.76948 type:complete len:200 (-) Transcript_42380:133-732(-)
MPFDPERPSPVVPNSHQAREWKQNKGPQWTCSCGESNENMAPYCLGCGLMRPEERALRQQARVGQGLGRGGGYFERSDAPERKPGDDEDDVCDIYGRRRRNASSSACAPSSSSSPAATAAPPGPETKAETSEASEQRETGSKPLSKAERQKLALERLRNPTKVSFSPPRTREYREPTSRSRSRKRKQQKQGFILSGGVR